jgi:TonB family protein
MKFCRFCGTPTGPVSAAETETQRFSSDTAPASPAPTQPVYLAPGQLAPQVTTPLRAPQRQRWPWIITGLLTAIVFVVAALAYKFYQDSQRQPQVFVIERHGADAIGSEGTPVATPTPPTPPAPPTPPPVKIPTVPAPPTPTPLGDTSTGAPPTPKETVPPPGAATETPESTSLQRVSPRALMANATRRVEPSWPSAVRPGMIRKPVVVEVVVDERGNVASAQAIAGPPALQSLALEAARQWKFRPFERDGQPIRVSSIPVFGDRAGMLNRMLRER